MSILNSTINDYQILSFIDSGSFGSVYKASKGNIIYAIKVFREEYVLKEFRGSKNRIHREIEIMKSVHHPYLIKYVDDFSEFNMEVPSYFLVMEYAEGSTLKNLLAQSTLTDERKAKIFRQIAEGIKALHDIRGTGEDRGIIHRDLKPENIIVNDQGIKILDYGISKIIDYTSITSTGDRLGSPLYMSPEQLVDSKNIDKRSDLYTLGVIYYEMLTNNFPYEFQSIHELYDKIKNENPIEPRRWNPLIKNDTENVILKLLDKMPYKRFPNIDSLLTAINVESKKIEVKPRDLSPRFYLRLWNDKAILTDFVKRNKEQIHVEFPANHQDQQKSLLTLIQNEQFVKMIDPATNRLAYAAQSDVKGLRSLPYSPPKFDIITPEYLNTNNKKQVYVKQVIDEQIKLGADILISPYHYIHNTNVPATQKRNPVADWFDLDVKLLKESIDYRNSLPVEGKKPLYAGICLNGDSLLDQSYKKDILNIFSAIDCDGYFIYVDCIDNKTNSSNLYHYITTLISLQKNTEKPVIAGRINSLGLGLLCAGISGYSSGAGRFDSFYENLYKEESDAYNMYERYYFPQLLSLVSIERKIPVKLEAITKIIGKCQCYYCQGKEYNQVIESKNSKLHFLEQISAEVESIKGIPINDRLNYFIGRIDRAIEHYKKLSSVFRNDDYQYLRNWKEVFEELHKFLA